VPVCWLPTFSQNARYASPASRRSEIQGWIASLQRIRAWLGVGWVEGWCALGGCRGRVQWAFGCQRACGVCSRLLEMVDVSTRSIRLSSG
jgi:bacterioferritin-associated ferredoxin